MNKTAAIILMLSLSVFSAGAESLDDLLFAATRYGSTPLKREMKLAARAELSKQMPAALRAAMKYIHGDNIGINVIVMEWVMEWPDEVVIPVMLEGLDDPKPETRRMAIFFLGFKKGAEHAEKIIPHLDNDTTRGAAIRTLGKWKYAGVRGSAESTLLTGNERQRVVAANALRDLADPAAVPVLVRALEDPVFTVRNAAARAIVILGADSLPENAGNPDTKRLLDRIRADAGFIQNEEATAGAPIAVDGNFFLP